ncbi:MAG: barstar family protein [Nitrospirales bacterium]|nr:barstar family protein [Nitrospirales bacterium]
MTPPPGFVLRVFDGRKCHTKAGLLGEFARVLDFPSYFGKNWDAFEECLTDLQWLPAPGYLFVMTDAEQVLPDHDEEYETFIKILEESGKVWGSEQDVRPEIPFHVLLAVAERQKSKRKNGKVPLSKP